jgi:hypothetical protein
MLEIAGGIFLALLAICALAAIGKTSTSRVDIIQIARRNELDRARQSTHKINNPLQEPQPMGLSGLNKYLSERQEDVEKQHARVVRLKGLWTDVKPTLEKSVELVNSALSPHGMHAMLSPPDFFDENQTIFGAVCTLQIDGRTSFALPYGGELTIALTDESGSVLYAGGCHTWSDGTRFRLNELTVEALADIIANTFKSILED